MGNQLDEAIKNNMLALVEESVEVLNEINWKPWHKGSRTLNKEALKDEICDCFIFVLNAAYESGMLSADFIDRIAAKQQKNMGRFL